MASSVAGVLVLAVFITGVVVLFGTTLAGVTEIGDTIKQTTRQEGMRARSMASITSATGDDGNDTLRISVQNAGALPIADFAAMDIVVQYPGTTRAPKRLTYTQTNPPPVGQWTKTSLSSQFGPEVWDPGEVLNIQASLFGTPCDTGTVTIGTPEGAKDTSHFSCPGYQWYVHAEATTINGATYYQLKNNTPSDGTATTISVTFSSGQTGRVSPTSNSGKLVFPLTDVSEIRATTWNVTYRAKRDTADLGFVWFTNACDISLTTAGSWQDIDLSVNGSDGDCSGLPLVPVGATGAIIELVNTIVTVTGTHNGASDSADLIDTTTDFTAAGVSVSDTVKNTSDNSSATISAISTTTNPNDTIAGILGGGAENDWDSGDTYAIFINDASAVVRGKEDTRDYISSNPQLLETETHRWQIVKLDSNQVMQGYIENTDIDFKLLGYTLGTDPTYFLAPVDITPAVANLWASVDVSSYVDTASDGVILLVDSTEGVPRNFGVRERGGSFSAPKNLTGHGNTMYLVGLNDDQQFEAFIEAASVKIYLVGQTKGSVVYYTLDGIVIDPTTGSWQEIDADTYGIPSKANGLIVYGVNNGAGASKLAFRHGSSTFDWNGDLAAGSHFQGAAVLRAADNVWDEFLEDTGIDVSIAAYTRLVQMDAHADINVLIRQADGAVRATLATNAANSGNITGTDWQTYTATFAFAGYTVVDQTDYLEIDLFAEATSNASEETLSVDFRFDDPTLTTLDQTRFLEIVP